MNAEVAGEMRRRRREWSGTIDGGGSVGRNARIAVFFSTETKQKTDRQHSQKLQMSKRDGNKH